MAFKLSCIDRAKGVPRRREMQRSLYGENRSWLGLNCWVKLDKHSMGMANSKWEGIIWIEERILKKKKERTDACYSVDAPCKRSAKWKKADTYCLIPFIWNVLKRHIPREDRSVIARGCSQERLRNNCSMGMGFVWLWHEENAGNQIEAVLHNTVNVLMPPNCLL